MSPVNPVGRPIDRGKDRAILAAARELLFGEGPQAVTMEAVAARAGVAKATVYARHVNREALIHAVVVEQSAQFSVHLVNEPADFACLRATLVRFCEQLLGFLTSDERLMVMRTLGATTGLPDSVFHKIYRAGPQATQDGLARWFESVAASGIMRCPEPVRSAELLLGMLIGLEQVRSIYRVACVHTEPTVRRAHVDFVVDTFLRAHAARDEDVDES